MNVKLKVIYFSVLSCFILQGCAAARLGVGLITVVPRGMFSKPDPNAPRSVSYTQMLQEFVGKPASSLNQYLGKPDVERSGVWEWGEERWVMAKINNSGIGPDMRERLNRDVCMVTAKLDKNDIITLIYYEEDIKKEFSVRCPPIINIQNHYYGKFKEVSKEKGKKNSK